MSAEPAPPGAVDCLRRGLGSLRANWPLVPVVAAQSVLTVALTVGGLLVLLAAAGIRTPGELGELDPGSAERLAEELAIALEAGPAALLPAVGPLVAATAIWTLAFAVYCFLQAGVVGTLAEGERAAGAGRPDWRRFRRFSPAGFARAGRQLFWPYVWFNHLLGALALGWTALLGALAALAAWLSAGAGAGAGYAAGCLGLGPLGLLLLIGLLWSVLATVEVARPGAGLRAASRRALSTLRRRPGPVALLSILAFVGWAAAGTALAPLEWALALAAGGRLVFWLAQALVGSTVTVGFLASLAALVGLGPAAAEAGA